MSDRLRAIGGCCLAMLIMSGVEAQQVKVLDGCYVPTTGVANTASYASSALTSPSTGQIGEALASLVHNSWETLSGEERSRIQRVLIIDGPIHGKLNDNNTPGFPFDDSVDHVIGDGDREGILLTEGDVFIPDPERTEFCDDGFVNVVLFGEEILNVKEGFGKYAGLDVSQTNIIKVRGAINTCNGRNDFEVVAGEGQLCFLATDEN